MSIDNFKNESDALNDKLAAMSDNSPEFVKARLAEHKIECSACSAIDRNLVKPNAVIPACGRRAELEAALESAAGPSTEAGAQPIPAGVIKAFEDALYDHAHSALQLQRDFISFQKFLAAPPTEERLREALLPSVDEIAEAIADAGLWPGVWQKMSEPERNATRQKAEGVHALLTRRAAPQEGPK